MKNRKKIMAVLLAAALATTSMTAFADEVTTATGSSTSTGSSVVENDNSTIPEYYDVILPTSNSKTYDFVIDGEQLLKEYDDEMGYENNARVYFKSTSTPASLKMKSTGSTKGEFYEVGYTDDTDNFKRNVVSTSALGFKTEFENLKAELNLNKIEPSNTVAGYYIWRPNTDSDADIEKGNGKWVPVTSSSAIDLFDVEYTMSGIDTSKTTLKTKKSRNKTNGYLFDGKVYKRDLIKQDDGKKLAEYIAYNESKLETNPIEAYVVTKEGLYFATSAATVYPASAQALHTGNAPEILIATTSAVAEYVKEEFGMKKTSDEAKVENKSAYPIAVEATVTVSSSDGLELVSSGAISGSATAAAMYFGLKVDGNGDNYVDSSKKTSVVYVLGSRYYDSTNTPLFNTYQGDDEETTTGSHKYHKYKTAEVFTTTYPAVKFTLEANCNYDTSNADKKKNWKAYVESVKETGEKPSIKVVYSFNAIKAKDETTKGLYTTVTGEAIDYKVKAANAYTGVATSSAVAGVATVKAHTVKTSANALYIRLLEGQEVVQSKVTVLKVNNVSKTVTVAGGVIKLTDQTYSDNTSYSVEVVYDGVTYVGKTK